MAITAANLTAGRDTTDLASYTTASVSPTAGRLELVSVFNTISAGTATLPAISGGGVSSWSQINTLTFNTFRLTVFRGVAPASPTPGTMTIDFSGNTQTSCSWSIDEFAGTETGGTDGANAIIQSPFSSTSNTTTPSVSLSALANVNNAAYGVFGHAANESSSAGGSFTRLSDQFGTSPSTGFMTEWAIGQTTVNASYATSIAARIAAIEISIPLVPAVGGTLSMMGV